MSDCTAVSKKFNNLVEIMKRLRAPGGCPWDREQTYLTLRRYIIEEAYELIEAIEKEDFNNMCEECGDLLLQVVFVSCIAAEHDNFDISNVIDYISEKLVRRHPHVFGDINLKNTEEVLRNWEQIKTGEREKRHEDSSLLAGIPRLLPSLLKAYRMQERAAKVGFDWPKDALSSVIAKVDEEITELKDAINNNNIDNVEEEIGDVFFTVVNLSRHFDIDPEASLHKACEKFASRFRCVEGQVSKSGKDWNAFTLNELDEFWNLAKIIVSTKNDEN